MRRTRRTFLGWTGLILALAIAGPSSAQQVIQSGKTVPGHAAKWITQNIAGDAGAAIPTNPGDGLTSLPIVGPGDPFCIYDISPAKAPAGYHSLCLGADSLDNGAFAGASALPFNFNVGGALNITAQGQLTFTSNGVVYPFPFTDTTSTHVPTQAALAAYNVSGTTIIRDGYYAAGDSPSVAYNQRSGACSLNAGAGDTGSQVPTAVGGNCWTANFSGIKPTPAIWGAKVDGTTDDSSAVQAAVNYLCSTTLPLPAGRQLYMAPGKNRFHDIAVPCGVRVEGSGIGSIGFGSGNPISSQVDCSDIVAFCIRFRPPGSYPAASQMDGGSVENIAFMTSNRTGVILEFDQIRAPTVKRVAIWNALNGIKIFGSIAGVIDDVQLWFISGIGIEGSGDMSGPGCTLSACATRSDSLYIDNIVGGDSAYTSTGYYFHDQMFTVQGNDMQWENGAYGLRVTCGAGQPDATYCPSHLIFKGLNLEFATAPLSLMDFSDFLCSQCYMAGKSTTTTGDDVFAGLANYTTTNGAGGGIVISDSQIYGASGSCVAIGVPDSKIRSSNIYACNGANTGAAGVEYTAGARHTLSDTTLCTFLGVVGTTMGSWLVDSGASDVSSSNNTYFGCSGNPQNHSSVPYTVYESNPNPPPSPVTVAAGPNGSGLGSGAMNVTGNDLGGVILLAPAGSPSAAGDVRLTMSAFHYPNVICTAITAGGSAAWTVGATVGNRTAPTTSYFDFDWANAGAALTAGQTYQIFYRCGGF